MPAWADTRPHSAAEDERPSARRRSRTPSGVGRTLREARIRAGVELADVQAQTGIETKYLRALEWERFDLLPDFDYARKAAKAEARVLQLDPESMSAELDRTIAVVPRYGPIPEHTRGTEPAPTPATAGSAAVESAPASEPPPSSPAAADPRAAEPVPVPLTAAETTDGDRRPARTPWSAQGTGSRSQPARRLVVGALVAGLVAFLIVDLAVLRDDEASGDPAEAQPVPASPPTATPPAPVARSDAGTGAPDADSAPTGPASASDETRPGESAPSDSPEDETPETGAGPGGGAGSAGAAGDSTDTETATRDGGTQPAGPAAVQQVEIRTARGESWLQVRRGTRTGPVLFEGLVQRGRTLEFEERALYIRAGAVAAIDIRQDGALVSKGLEGTLDLKLTRANGLRVVS